MPLMTGALAPGRCSSAFRQAQVDFSPLQHRVILHTRPNFSQCRRGRSRFANHPVLAGPVTADKSASQKASQNNIGHKPKVVCQYRFAVRKSRSLLRKTVHFQHSSNGSAVSTKLVGPPLNERYGIL